MHDICEMTMTPDDSEFDESDDQSSESHEYHTFGVDDFELNTVDPENDGFDDVDASDYSYIEEEESSGENDSISSPGISKDRKKQNNEGNDRSDTSESNEHNEHSIDGEDQEENDECSDYEADGDSEDEDSEQYDDCDQERHDSCVTLLRLLNHQASRWHNVDFRMSLEWFHDFNFSQFLQGLPNLNSLRFKLDWLGVETTLDLRNCPMLQHINLVYPCPCPIRLNVQWAHILHLELTICPIDLCMEILSQSPNIISCRVIYPLARWSVPGFPDEDWRFGKRVLLPHLKKLTIDNRRDMNLMHFFDSISAPMLTGLYYEGGKITNCSPICDFISRSPILREFSLSNARIPSNDILVQLLRGLRNIVQLTLVDPLPAPSSLSLNDHILSLCTPTATNDKECILPSLEMFSYTGPPAFTSTVMKRFIESRKPTILGDEPRSIAFLRLATITLRPNESSETSNMFFRAPPTTLALK